MSAARHVVFVGFSDLLLCIRESTKLSDVRKNVAPFKIYNVFGDFALRFSSLKQI